MVPKPVTEREKKIPAGPLLLFDMCGLDTFIMTIGLTYMPIQPVASFLCFWYFWWGVVPRKLQPQVYESQFRRGRLADGRVHGRQARPPRLGRRPEGLVGS